ARPPKARATCRKTSPKYRTAQSRPARSPRQYSRRLPNWPINLTCCGARSNATWRNCAWRHRRQLASEIFLRTRRKAAFACAAVLFAQVGKIALAGITGDRAQLVLRGTFRRRGRREEPGILPQRFCHRGLHPPSSVLRFPAMPTGPPWMTRRQEISIPCDHATGFAAARPFQCVHEMGKRCLLRLPAEPDENGGGSTNTHCDIHESLLFGLRVCRLTAS